MIRTSACLSLICLSCAVAAAQPVEGSFELAGITSDNAALAATQPTRSLAAPKRARSSKKRAPDAASRRVGDANRSATRPPTSSGFVNAVQVHTFETGAVYDLLTAPGQVTDIALEEGEVLNAVASGDTLRWVIGDSASGLAGTRRVHVLVKPVAAGLATNLVITTDRRSYHLRLRSLASTAMVGMSWTYPEHALLALKRGGGSAEATVPLGKGFDPVAFNFGYAISGDRPDWRPLGAFDDGRQTFIEFGEDISAGEAPPLFLIGSDGPELVNYRMRGRFYIVDRLFDRAELRLGRDDAKVVRITRRSADKPRRRGSDR